MQKVSEHSSILEDLEKGWSLPANWYTDPAIVELEYERIFNRSWQYIGRSEQLTKVGDCVTGVIGQIPVVIVKNDKGIEGFVNVCRHRRHEVVHGCGNRKILQCPYHAWTYDLGGKLKAAPRCESEPDFNMEEFPLLPVRVEVWGPWVFANADIDARPLTYYLGELPSIIERSGIDINKMIFHSRSEWESNGNWKVMLENYLECYHCAVQHPGFSAVIDVAPDNYELKAYEWHSSQLAQLKEGAEKGGKKAGYDPSGQVACAQYHLFWPNFTININPGKPNLSVDVWLPNGPNGAKGISEQYFGEGVPVDWQNDLIAFNEQVGHEDDALTDSVQRGMRAGVPERGRFFRKAENLALHFCKMVVKAVTAE